MCKDVVNATTTAAGLATLAVWATHPLALAWGKTQTEIHLGGVAAWLGATARILLAGSSRHSTSRSATSKSSERNQVRQEFPAMSR